MVSHVALNIPKNKNKYFRFENISEINVSTDIGYQYTE